MAFEAISDVCKNNTSLSIDAFKILEFSVTIPVESNSVVNVIQYEEVAHGEISTKVYDIQCDEVKDVDIDDYFVVEYKVNNVYHIKE